MHRHSLIKLNLKDLSEACFMPLVMKSLATNKKQQMCQLFKPTSDEHIIMLDL